MEMGFKITRLEKNPVQQVFSLRKIYNYWLEKSKSSSKIDSTYAGILLKEMDKHPEIINSDGKKPLLKRFDKSFRRITSFLFSEFQHEHEMIGISVPYKFKFYYTSEKMDEVFGKRGKTLLNDFFGYHKGVNYYGTTLHTYGRILNEFYGAQTNFQVPVLSFNKMDKVEGISKNYDILIDQSYCDIIVKNKLPELSEEEISHAANNFYDLELLFNTIPPENFEMHGFTMIKVFESTINRVSIAIRDKLLDKDAIVSRKHVTKIESLVKALLNVPELRLGIGLAAYDNKQQMIDGSDAGIASLLINADNICTNLEDSIHEKAIESGYPVVISDLEKYESKHPLTTEYLNAGYKSLILIPLFMESHPLGMLELGSPNTNDLNNLSLMNLLGIVPAFSIAALRISNDFNNKIKAKIQEEFTAIHPVVEWKFNQSASKLIQMEEGDDKIEKENIVFKDVYPLYGAIDVRSSSHERNSAIVEDLVEQLNDADKIFNKALKKKEMPVFNQLKFQIGEHLQSLDKGLFSGDETRIIEFLKREVEPVFTHLSEAIPELKKDIEKYLSKIDPEHGMIYKKRNEFELSIGSINDTVSSIIDEQEKSAQQMFPHYFEKYRTDGIEYNIYLGYSILENLKFDHVYLKNMRLWELIIMCKIARKTSEIRDELPVPLETTQLILVHSNPLDIRFREDEKKFDVEGGYNIRYEIIKKRIDKSLVKGSGERLTQPGSIAIIYSQPSEYYQYKKYIEYLQSVNYINEEIETFELEDMQGVYGLKAIRVKVNISTSIDKPLDNMKEIAEETSKKL